MRSDNLLSIRKRKFKRTTNSEHGFTVYPNLAQYVEIKATNQLWVANITYLRLGREFVYLAVVLDVFSRRGVGWSLGRSLQTTLPLAALQQAILDRQPGAGLVHHSDRGSPARQQRLREATGGGSDGHQHEPSLQTLVKGLLRKFYEYAQTRTDQLSELCGHGGFANRDDRVHRPVL